MAITEKVTEASINVPMSQKLFDRVTAEAEWTRRSRAYVLREAAEVYLESTERDRAAAQGAAHWKDPEEAYADILRDMTESYFTEYEDGQELTVDELATEYEVDKDVIVRVAETLIGRGLLRPERQYLVVTKEDS